MPIRGSSSGTRTAAGPAACGNATRCVARLLMGELRRGAATFTTERGTCWPRMRRQDGLISVNMGDPMLDWAGRSAGRAISDLLHLPLARRSGRGRHGQSAYAFFVPDAEAVDLSARAPTVEHHPLFPQRNERRVRQTVTAADQISMRVWERGTGITLACGSGACAAAVAAPRRGLTGRQVSA